MLRNANQLHVDRLSLDVPGRLAKWLLQRCARSSRNADDSVSFPLGRSQSDLAGQLGTTRSTLNRALHGFANLGLITFDGEIVHILDEQGFIGYTV